MPRRVDEVLDGAGFEEGSNLPPKKHRGARAFGRLIGSMRKVERQWESDLNASQAQNMLLEAKIRTMLEDLRGRDQIISDLRRELDKAKLVHNVDVLKLSKDDRKLLLGEAEAA